MDDLETPWEPEPIDAETFHQGPWANINRAPYDQVSGVTFKRAPNIKRVRYSPADPAPEMPEPWQGSGDAVVHWLFSELPGTEEHLLEGATFAFLHDFTLAPGASTGQKANPGPVQPAAVELKSHREKAALARSAGRERLEHKAAKTPLPGLFCHLHTHSQYSVLQATPDIKRLIKKAVSLKMPAVALTDMGNVFGAYSFVKEALENNIKPIVGCEMYIARERLKQLHARHHPRG